MPTHMSHSAVSRHTGEAREIACLLLCLLQEAVLFTPHRAHCLPSHHTKHTASPHTTQSTLPPPHTTQSTLSPPHTTQSTLPPLTPHRAHCLPLTLSPAQSLYHSTHPIEAEQEFVFESPCGTVLTRAALRQEGVHFICGRW